MPAIRSLKPMLEIITELQTSIECTDEETELLTALAGRYAKRDV